MKNSPEQGREKQRHSKRSPVKGKISIGGVVGGKEALGGGSRGGREAWGEAQGELEWWVWKSKVSGN